MCPVKVRALRGDSIAALPKAVLPGKKAAFKTPLLKFWGQDGGEPVSSSLFSPLFYTFVFRGPVLNA